MIMFIILDNYRTGRLDAPSLLSSLNFKLLLFLGENDSTERSKSANEKRALVPNGASLLLPAHAAACQNIHQVKVS